MLADTILVIDDEPQIRRVVKNALASEVSSVLEAGDGAQGLAMASAERPTLVVLDLGLPDMAGIDVCRLLRSRSAAPIVVLSARHSDQEKASLLDSGADDYITKPFSPRELVARVRAVLRRTEPAPTADGIFHRGDVTLDVARMRVWRAGQPIELTTTEFHLLAALARQPGRVFSRTQLLDAVRGSEIESFERAIDAHVKNIRRKLEPDPHSPRYVLTVYGAGYRFAEE
jgi:two-component system, OmpR family, alkaline phosphatase synthesis response regulator PhoP